MTPNESLDSALVWLKGWKTVASCMESICEV